MAKKKIAVEEKPETLCRIFRLEEVTHVKDLKQGDIFVMYEPNGDPAIGGIALEFIEFKDGNAFEAKHPFMGRA